MSTFARAGWLLVFSAWLLVPCTNAGNVILVHSGGTGDFFRIQPAVDLAVDGDTILVKGGTYPGFSIDDKRVNVVANPGQTVLVLGTVQVTNLAASRDVILAGLTVEGTGYGFNFLNAVGSVRVQDCTALGADGSDNRWHGALVEECNDVAFVRCELEGGRDTYISGSGLWATNSHVALQDCTLQGANGYDADCWNTLDGSHAGHGALATQSFLFASGTSFRGGHGGDAVLNCDISGDGGGGGAGLALNGSGTEGDVLGCTFTGGSGGGMGCGPFVCGDMGWTGPPTWIVNGAVLNTLSGSPRELLAPTVVREHSLGVALTISGQPDDAVILMASQHASFDFLPNQQGVRLLPTMPPPFLRHLGYIIASNTMQTVVPTFVLGEGVECRTYFLQTQHQLPNGQRQLGGFHSLVVLDSAF